MSAPAPTSVFSPSAKARRHARATDGEESEWGAGDFAPETVVRLAPQGGLQFSLDAGENWRPVPETPNARGGHIAVSADGRTWVWSLPEASYRTDDYGFVWTPCEGLSPGMRVVADRTSPARFYALDLAGDRLWLSEDGARHFRSKALSLSGGPVSRGELCPTPGRSGDLWLAAPEGLYHSPVGRAWVRLAEVAETRAFGFGKGGGESAALYVSGFVRGARGVFRSYDEGGSWSRIAGDAEGWGDVIRIAGDPTRRGRVYVETHGRGLLVGDPK